MEIKFVYSTRSLILTSQTLINQNTLRTVLEILGKRFLLYFQGTMIQYKDCDGIHLSLDHIIQCKVSLIFVSVPDGTQNMKGHIKPTKDYKSLPLKKIDSFMINSNGCLIETQVLHPLKPQESIEVSVIDEKNIQDQDSGPQEKTYSLIDLRTHNKNSDCWMALEGKVYDVTKYISSHPGGDIILNAAGTDGTEFFKSYHPWVDPQEYVGKYFLGNLNR
ncbi:hypothetical protein SteCoe_7699 [Stentor coeruleus]|uniref:Cytochrome b5 heme-binding domain-containing protein n=1 Tax=Stentor coeruleus TaxID=5963 RepID=A0A1R2CM51_9CILI|nr:hypothetical protein SteCoe_7699 [Stentor coeruleus]